MAEDALRAGEGLGEEPEDALRARALELALEATSKNAEMVETILVLRRKLREAEVAVPEDLSKFMEMLQRIDTRLTLVERDAADAVPGPKVKLFVTEVVSPIQKSVDKIESAITKLSDESKELYDAHKSFITKEQERKDEQARERTPMGLVKKYGPLVAFITTAIALFRVLGTFAEAYIQAQVHK